ncbi:MAG: XRE family transcriptional regulator [Desulfovibrio sp.]|nr:XRE family transcriptional regulator [Desulfovibrio sp.]
MKTNSESNQLSHAAQADPRMLDLRVWLIRRGLTYVALGKAMGGITGNAVQCLLQQDRIPIARHTQFVELGVPSHLLPPAMDVRRGRPAVSK